MIGNFTITFSTTMMIINRDGNRRVIGRETVGRRARTVIGSRTVTAERATGTRIAIGIRTATGAQMTATGVRMAAIGSRAATETEKLVIGIRTVIGIQPAEIQGVIAI